MSATSGADKTIKVLLIGDSGVGKSSLLLSFTTGAFDENISATIGIDFKVKKVSVVDMHSGNKATVNLQLWDTAGQERFRTLTSSYYRGAQAVVLVYDVNEPQSFHGLQKWLDEANSYCRRDEAERHNIVFLLVGNKTDLCAGEDAMALPQSTAQAFAQENNMLFALASAKTRIGVAQAFDEVARNVYERLQDMDQCERRRTTNLNSGGDGGAGGQGCC
ncbi:small GTP-binding protein Rab18 [Novymonas esmeraldas]|uniref:Small GTP-binding protein Rab18 n=1 Tax=Novymonas esmeraldas TaxID=1808958 RepID=A0AAW0FE83_9TRYP